MKPKFVIKKNHENDKPSFVLEFAGKKILSRWGMPEIFMAITDIRKKYKDDGAENFNIQINADVFGYVYACIPTADEDY